MSVTLTQKVRSRLTIGDAGGFDRRLLTPMVLGATLNPINSSILAVSLAPIGIAFGAPPSQTAWLVSGRYLATSIGQPVVGGGSACRWSRCPRTVFGPFGPNFAMDQPASSAHTRAALGWQPTHAGPLADLENLQP